jgi:hypothetical protein
MAKRRKMYCPRARKQDSHEAHDWVCPHGLYDQVSDVEVHCPGIKFNNS